jgi:large repetitive protein
VSKTEGNSGTSNATFTVTLTGATELAATVNYTTANDTATAPADYTSTTGMLTFNPGETSKTVNVPVVGDVLDEPDETFKVNLSSPSNATLSDGQGIGTIVDDDDPPSLSIADGSVTEGNVGTVSLPLTVSLPAASGKTITVAYSSADASATAPSQYTAVSGTLTFNPGETSKTINVPVVGDTVVEPNETFTVTLSSPTNATITRATATGTIVDDDTAPPASPPVASVSDVSVTEGDTGTSPATPANFTVSLSKTDAGPVSVQFAIASGTATAPADYGAATGAVTFSPGETSKTVTVSVVGDKLAESNETFQLNLSSPSNATIGDGQGIGTIVDDDVAGPAGGVNGGDLFCGVKHRGKCVGIPFKAEFDRPGNAVWEFGAFNPSPGRAAGAYAAAVPPKLVKLGTLRVKVKKAGVVRVVFKLKPGAKTKKLYRKVRKLKALRVKLTFTPTSGPKLIKTSDFKLKR